MQMKRILFSAFHVAALLAGTAAVNLRSSKTQGGEEFFQFDYAQHGQDWVSGSCASRSRQSPIDLPAAAASGGKFMYKYEPITAPFDFMNNGHSFSGDFAGLGYGGITYNDAYYQLMNVNIHSLSEHSWGGVKKPIELHLVHKHYATEALLIVAVGIESATPLGKMPQFLQVNASSDKQVPPKPMNFFYKEPPSSEPNFNPTLQAFLKLEPPSVNMKVNVPMSPRNSIDLTSMLMGGQFFEYAGSLTAPPCAEIATWLVRKDILKASDRQVLYLHDAIYKTTADFGNFRSLMPLNGREIHELQATMEDPPKAQQAAIPMGGEPQHTDREFRAMKWAMDAMTIAKGATDYIKDLDMRLRNAAQAHAEALAPRLEPLDAPGEGGAAGAAGGKAPVLPLEGSRPAPNGAPLQMENTAKQMAATIAQAARAEVEDATKQISKKAKEAALNAAIEAAGLVGKGTGDHAALANTVALPALQPAAAPAGPPPPPLR